MMYIVVQDNFPLVVGDGSKPSRWTSLGSWNYCEDIGATIICHSSARRADMEASFGPHS